VADLDLSTQEGLRIARERIHQVARNLCTQLASPLDLSHQSNFVACVESAMDRASRQLAGPALAVARSTAASVDQPL
jgi:UrcA family protein